MSSLVYSVEYATKENADLIASYNDQLKFETEGDHLDCH